MVHPQVRPTALQDRRPAALLRRGTLNNHGGPGEAQWDPRPIFSQPDAQGMFPPSSRSCKGKVEATGYLFEARGFLYEGFIAGSSEKAPLTWEITQSCHADHLGSPPISSRAEPSLPHLPLPWRKEAAQGTSASFPGCSHVVHSVLATALALGPSRALRVPVKGQPGQTQRTVAGWAREAHTLPHEAMCVGLWVRKTPPGFAQVSHPGWLGLGCDSCTVPPWSACWRFLAGGQGAASFQHSLQRHSPQGARRPGSHTRLPGRLCQLGLKDGANRGRLQGCTEGSWGNTASA